MNQKGVITLVIPLLLLVTAAAIIFILVSQGLIENPLQTLPLPGQKIEPTVKLQNQYQNPFDKSAGYRNPFSEYTNPFDALKK